MSTNAELDKRREQAVARGVGTIHGVYADRALNAEIHDVEGRRFIDFAGGIGVLNVGHRHPRVMAAVQAQLERFTHTCFHVAPYEPYIALAERLNALAPGDFPKKTLLVNTGAEAIENAVKIARAATGRSAIIAFNGGFHGRTMMALALTGKVDPYKKGFGPMPGDVWHAPYPSALHGISDDASIAAIEQLFKADVEPSRVAAIIIEPVQGEGGFYVASPQFLRKLRALCDRHGILLVADEVQSGSARTGTMFAIEHAAVVPDLIVLAKSVAGGFPLAAVTGRAQVMDAVAPGGLGGTYGGNPISCAAALAVLDVFAEEGLFARASALGERLQARFKAMAREVPAIGDVRGLGAMVAVELFADRERTAPDAELTRTVVAEAARRGLLLLPCGVYGNVIRVLVPITASDAVVDEGMDILQAAFAQATKLRSAA